MIDIWIPLTAFCVALSCALLGNLLLLQNKSMLADTLSHAVLPGIVIGFLMAENRSSLWVLFFAFVFAMLATFVVQMLHRFVKLQGDQSIGITYIWLFSLGLVLIGLLTDRIDLDIDHVLFGEIQYAWLPPYWHFYQLLIPIHFVPIFLNLLMVIFVVMYYFQSLKILSFDENFAKVKNIKTQRLHYLLMALVALSCVTAFEHVGSVMVIGFFVLIPATCYLLARSLRQMVVLSILLSVLSAFVGYRLAVWVDVSVAGSMSVTITAFFALALLYNLAKQKKRKLFFQKLFYEQQQEKGQ